MRRSDSGVPAGHDTCADSFLSFLTFFEKSAFSLKLRGSPFYERLTPGSRPTQSGPLLMTSRLRSRKEEGTGRGGGWGPCSGIPSARLVPDCSITMIIISCVFLLFPSSSSFLLPLLPSPCSHSPSALCPPRQRREKGRERGRGKKKKEEEEANALKGLVSCLPELIEIV